MTPMRSSRGFLGMCLLAAMHSAWGHRMVADVQGGELHTEKGGVKLCSGGGVDCWRNKVVYQILTDRFDTGEDGAGPCGDLKRYCGGTFKGIIRKLDYIKGLGADAIWISPVTENMPDGYHGYWPQSLTKINSHFGTAEDLKSLVEACHKLDMMVMVDVVANHMGHEWPDIKEFDPPLNNPNYFMDCEACEAAGGGERDKIDNTNCRSQPLGCRCWVQDWNNPEQQLTCQLFGLPGLDQNNPEVAKLLKEYAASMHSTYGIDGLRLDTVPYVPKAFWNEFTAAGGVFSIGEVLTEHDGQCLEYITGAKQPMDSVLNYPLYKVNVNVFVNGLESMRKISAKIKYQQAHYGDTFPLLGNFAECHDMDRVLQKTQDLGQRQAFYLYVLAAEGIPIIYYGMEQSYRGGPDQHDNREVLWTSQFKTDDAHEGMYRFIATVNHYRHQLPPEDFADAPQVERWVDDDLMVFQRGKAVVALTNVGTQGSTVSQAVPNIEAEEGAKLCNIFWPDDCVQVQGGLMQITLEHGESKVFVPADSLG